MEERGVLRAGSPKKALLTVMVALVVVVMALTALWVLSPKGTVNPPAPQRTDAQRIRDADQTLLTQMLSKLAEVTENKTLQVALQLRNAFNQMAGLFSNTSAQPTIRLQHDYICGNTINGRPFVQAEFAPNYIRICNSFNSTAFWSAPIDSGQDSAVEFQPAFDNLLWSMIELDNLIVRDP